MDEMTPFDSRANTITNTGANTPATGEMQSPEKLNT